MFELVRKEIIGVGDLIISRTFRFGSCCVYVSSSYNDEEPHNKYMTSYYQDKDNPRIECSCKLFECEGIPCCHIFNVMKHERINKIFSSLVLKRWTKSAKVDMQTSFSEGEVPKESIEFARYIVHTIVFYRCFYFKLTMSLLCCFCIFFLLSDDVVILLVNHIYCRYGDLNCFGSKLCYLASKTKKRGHRHREQRIHEIRTHTIRLVEARKRK